MLGGDDRTAADWGHWTGRGMTWNVQCAYCHMTDFKKNYDAKTDTYHSSWTEMGVGCTQCHGEIVEHPRREDRMPDRYHDPRDLLARHRDGRMCDVPQPARGVERGLRARGHLRGPLPAGAAVPAAPLLRGRPGEGRGLRLRLAPDEQDGPQGGDLHGLPRCRTRRRSSCPWSTTRCACSATRGGRTAGSKGRRSSSRSSTASTSTTARATSAWSAT